MNSGGKRQKGKRKWGMKPKGGVWRERKRERGDGVNWKGKRVEVEGRRGKQGMNWQGRARLGMHR